mmetsp:Transcript_13664/g.23352  ORF Transcript_13664/g.23352 Transcript_13664/m.23352 type:complete len:195 (+) Transcript_13664:60-644(+)
MSDGEHNDGYNPGEKIDMKTLAEMDAEDESLRKYKEALLGKMDDFSSPSDDPRKVVIQSMTIIFEERPGGNLEFDLSSEAEIEKFKKAPIIFKEGCKYKIQVNFKVQHEIVSGLKYLNQVFRKGLRVAKEEEMLGSFGPQKDNHSVTFPKQGWDSAPKGTLARGSYTAKSKFIDDDKQTHMQYEYSFQIKKDWQ